jgi:hypothetical protein
VAADDQLADLRESHAQELRKRDEAAAASSAEMEAKIST